MGYVWDLVVHLDRHLNELATGMGPWFYLLLFAVVFCETGLVVTPFLPGDSLLFAVGALVASPTSTLSLPLLMVLLIAAAILGDAVNYAIGAYLGPKVFQYEDSWFFNKKHLMRAHEFYEKYGGKTIIFARFIPIIRTFAPFVAGIGRMTYRRFCIYNIAGALCWVIGFLSVGWWVGEQPVVKQNFQLIILGIIVISVMPAVIEMALAYKRKNAVVRV